MQKGFFIFAFRDQETIMKGFDALPDAFIGLFSGENTGKLLVEI